MEKSPIKASTTNKKTNTGTQALVPDSWPGAFGAYKYSKAAVKQVLTSLVLLYLIMFGVSIVLSVIRSPFLAQIINLAVSTVVGVAVTLLFLAGIRGKTLAVGESISSSYKFFWRALALNIIIAFALFGSFLLFIIPFFFVLPRVSLAVFYLVDKDMDVMEAFRASWDNTKGNSGKIWGIYGASFAMAMLMFTIIGIPFAIYFLVMYSAATVVIYEYINKQTGDSKTATTRASSAPKVVPQA